MFSVEGKNNPTCLRALREKLSEFYFKLVEEDTNRIIDKCEDEKKREEYIVNVKEASKIYEKGFIYLFKKQGVDPRLGYDIYVFAPNSYVANQETKVSKILTDLIGEISIEEVDKKKTIYLKKDFDYKTNLYLCFSSEYEKLFIKEYGKLLKAQKKVQKEARKVY